MGSLIKITDDRSGEKEISIEQVDANSNRFHTQVTSGDGTGGNQKRGDIMYSESKHRFSLQGPILKQSKLAKNMVRSSYADKLTPKKQGRRADMISSFDLNDQSDYNDMNQHSILAMS